MMAEETTTEVGEHFPEALPRNTILVQVAGRYRLLWDLGDGLGFARYSLSNKQLRDIYGDDYQDHINETYDNIEQLKAAHNSYYWGNAAEISLTSDSPWDDMKNRIFASFGYVGGLDTDEVKRLSLQGYFEGWSGAEFSVHYKQTSYYNGLTDLQRQWATMSDAEKDQRIREESAKMVDRWNYHYGIDPDGGLDNIDLLAAAESVASGELTWDEWDYTTERGAREVEDSPAHRREIDETQATGQREVDIETNRGQVEDWWRSWVGPVGMPDSDWTNKWASDIFMNESSWEDLEEHLKTLSASSWSEKDPNVRWSEWAMAPRENIRRMLEMGSVDDDDSLLNHLLSNNLRGVDATSAIRADGRYSETIGYRDEVAESVNKLGSMFGYV